MNSVAIAGIVFACAFGGALLGLALRSVLPSRHLHDESKEVIKLGTGLVATIAALVLGLMISAANTNFDAAQSGFQQLAADIVLLDRALAHFGPEAEPTRELLATTVRATLARNWPDSDRHDAVGEDRALSADAAALYDAIHKLNPTNNEQQTLRKHALDLAFEMARTRWSLTQHNDLSMPILFLVVLVFWLFVLFACFGLYSTANGTVIAVLLVCALSVAGAIFLIVDLGQPSKGLVQISSAPLRMALTEIGK